MTKESVESSARYENYIKLGMLRNFWVHFYLLRYSGTSLKKELTFLLVIKTKSSWRYYVTFNSTFAFWDILEHNFKKCWNFC